ncbi:hypothetical protein FSP39_020147 [Pinctada imbricata]|uniref:MICAL-like protein 2 n=1 Tax=Pinctada imbricata TaxID=66713 RepID=A0AA89BQC8_PINIB|nr:hypothetical protein FSP39_020147 [Pinctada imbricata]
MATKVKALQMWCKKMADGYRDVEVRDMTSSWKDGLAFCAIIHRHRPDLIDYDALSKENIFDNNQLAFEVAEKELGIPALLDAPDMVAIRVPDKLSVVTYVSQYYNYFCNKPQLGGPGVKKPNTLKRTQATPTGPDAKRQSLGPNDGTPNKDRQVSMGDKCAICHKKVYLLERHVNEGQLYHRTCFRSSDNSPQRKINKRLDAMGDRESDEKKSLQDKKGEEPNFWKRRADAKKTESKSNGHVNSDADKGQVPSKKHDSSGVLSSLVHNLKGSDSKSKQPSQHNAPTETSDKTKDNVTSRPADLKLDSHSVDIKNNKNLDSVGGTTKSEPDVKVNVVPPRPRARHVAKIGAYKEKHEEEPMDTSHSSDDIQTKRQSTGNILDRTKPTNKTEGKKEEQKSVVAPPRARHVVKITAKKEESDVRERSKSPLQSKPVPSARTPESLSKTGAKNDEDSSANKRSMSPMYKSSTTAKTPESPPPLPSSLPPTVKPSTPSSPPPLPSNLPPQLKSSPLSPISLPSSRGKSPPRTDSSHSNKNSQIHELNSKESPKAKPRHAKTAVESKAKEKNDSASSIVSPTKQDQELLGGLLKNLADIRQRKSSSESNDKSPLSPTQGLSSKLQNIQESKEGRRDIKSLDIDAEKKKDRAGKAKSDFLSGKLSVFSSESESVSDRPKTEKKVKSDFNSNEDDDIPAWKKALEERKKKNLRPKSEAVLNEESQVNEPAWKSGLNKKNANRPKSMDILSEIDKEKDQKPAWQLEAEKRMAANEKKFVDPEKNRIDQGVKKNEKTDNSKPRPYTAYGELESRSKSPVSGKVTDNSESKVKSRILPTAPSDSKQSETEKKKISVDTKFSFNLNFKDKEKEKDPGKPPRPPTSPAALKSKIGTAEDDRSSIHSPPLRPPAPRSTEVKTFVTQEEEEDEVMMVEWFKLVNEKNDLVRQEADLIYRSRAQELEDEQHDIDMKLRRLIKKPEFMRTEEDKKEEEYLLNKLVEIVNQRSLIVDSQDEDRIRYEEEDREIAEILASKGKENMAAYQYLDFSQVTCVISSF